MGLVGSEAYDWRNTTFISLDGTWRLCDNFKNLANFSPTIKAAQME